MQFEVAPLSLLGNDAVKLMADKGKGKCAASLLELVQLYLLDF